MQRRLLTINADLGTLAFLRDREVLDQRTCRAIADSIDGVAAARAMLNNRRIRAGSNLNGSMYGPVIAAGLDRPFLLMCSQLRDMGEDPTWAELRSHLRGWRT